MTISAIVFLENIGIELQFNYAQSKYTRTQVNTSLGQTEEDMTSSETTMFLYAGLVYKVDFLKADQKQ